MGLWKMLAKCAAGFSLPATKIRSRTVCVCYCVCVRMSGSHFKSSVELFLYALTADSGTTAGI